VAVQPSEGEAMNEYVLNRERINKWVEAIAKAINAQGGIIGEFPIEEIREIVAHILFDKTVINAKDHGPLVKDGDTLYQVFLDDRIEGVLQKRLAFFDKLLNRIKTLEKDNLEIKEWIALHRSMGLRS